MDTSSDYSYNDGYWNWYDWWHEWREERYPENGKNVGWVCPKCGRAFAPWVNECLYCTKQNYTITRWEYPNSGTYSVDSDGITIRYQ